jgi:hypothetical protein
MDALKIIAKGDSDGAKANARGKLFEKVAAEVLRHSGYEIDQHQQSVNLSGMEIDIVGKLRVAGTPLYAECKCYANNIDSEKLVKFFGKYMTKWLENDKVHGLFLALPGLNSHAMGFFRDHCESNPKITLRLMQEPQVLDALQEAGIVVRPESYESCLALNSGHGAPGDRILICSDIGYFWLQYLIPLGAGIAKAIQIFDSAGNTVSEEETVKYLRRLMPETQQFQLAQGTSGSLSVSHSPSEPTDDVVEVQGSSACFEYQFPAAPEFFVGRESFLNEIKEFSKKVADRRTSSRGILFEANSGWGKSSLVLASLDALAQMGHFAVAFDSRSASSPHFILGIVEHILDKFGDFDGLVVDQPAIGGFAGASELLLQIGKQLEREDKLLIVFFDQFENVFHLPEVLSRLATLCLKVADRGTNLVLGFSWKTDLVGLTRDFPYRWRDSIVNACEVMHLSPFSEAETSALLDRLSAELHAKLRKDLRFLLSDFSQGYPWLLKKLCAHVKSLRQAGVIQSEMVRGLLNVEQLFHEDLQGLTAEQEEALRRTARLAPVNIWDIGEEFAPEVLQSLVDRRLIVRVGSKYDIYWDIFRDYLNTGKLPIEEVYVLRAQCGSILNALSILLKAPDGVDISDFKVKAGLSEG